MSEPRKKVAAKKYGKICAFANCFDMKRNKNLRKIDDLADAIRKRSESDNDGWLKMMLLSNLDHGDRYFYLTALFADVISEDPDFAKKLANSWGDTTIISFEHFIAEQKYPPLSSVAKQATIEAMTNPSGLVRFLTENNKKFDKDGWLRKSWFPTGKQKKLYEVERWILRLHICLFIGSKALMKPTLIKAWGLSPRVLEREQIWFRGWFQSPVVGECPVPPTPINPAKNRLQGFGSVFFPRNNHAPRKPEKKTTLQVSRPVAKQLTFEVRHEGMDYFLGTSKRGLVNSGMSPEKTKARNTRTPLKSRPLARNNAPAQDASEDQDLEGNDSLEVVLLEVIPTEPPGDEFSFPMQDDSSFEYDPDLSIHSEPHLRIDTTN
jgi:hypothetical protein